MLERPSVSILTYVLEPHHCALLEDWFDFFDHPVASLIVHVGADPLIRDKLTEICEKRGIRFTSLGVRTAAEIIPNELTLLREQFSAVVDGLGCVIRLDTLPFKAPGVTWQDEALDAMESSGALFITGSTQPFRADRPLRRNSLMLTQRVSNCFLIVAPEVWVRLQQGTQGSFERYGRYVVEGAPEDYLLANGLWGIRLVNRFDLRLFHTQEWSPRILQVRAAFHTGKGISRFLKGHAEDYSGSYYMKSGLPPLRRLRIVLGTWRRKALAAFGLGQSVKP